MICLLDHSSSRVFHQQSTLHGLEVSLRLKLVNLFLCPLGLSCVSWPEGLPFLRLPLREFLQKFHLCSAPAVPSMPAHSSCVSSLSHHGALLPSPRVLGAHLGAVSVLWQWLLSPSDGLLVARAHLARQTVCIWCQHVFSASSSGVRIPVKSCSSCWCSSQSSS